MTSIEETINKKEIFEDNALSSFYESLGVRVITQGGYLWHSDGLRLFVPLPCRGAIVPSREDLNSLWRKGAFFLRYPTLDPELPAYPSYIHLVDDKNYDLGSLSKSARSKTRRALKKCHVEKIPVDSLLPQARPLIEQTFNRQRRIVTRDTFSAWENYLAVASKNPLFETWAVFVESELAAFWDCLIYRGGCYGEGLFSRPDFLDHHVINSLIFISTRDVIRRAEVDHVSYGMRAMFGDSESLNSFKESMGYKRLQVGEHIALAPWLRPAFDNGVSKLIRYVAKKYYYASPTAKRIRAMITTYGSQDRQYLDKMSVSETAKSANQETSRTGDNDGPQ